MTEKFHKNSTRHERFENGCTGVIAVAFLCPALKDANVLLWSYVLIVLRNERH